MTRAKSKPQYRLTSLGKAVLIIVLISLFALGLVIGKHLFSASGAAGTPDNTPNAAVSTDDGQDSGGYSVVGL